MIFGTIEAGGTKFVLSVIDEQLEVINRLELETKAPDVTLSLCVDFFKKFPIKALGIGFFGPIDLDVNSPLYGYVLNTPKPFWSQTDIVGFFRSELGVSVGFDTDVNAACLAEHEFGAGSGVSDLVYLTVGTGIGGGIISNNQLVHGYMHPEIGHSSLVRHSSDLDFECNCPFHDSCAEGLAAGPSLYKRYGVKGQDLEDSHLAWDVEAYYLGQLVNNLVLTCCPKKVILGGGVMHKEGLIRRVKYYFDQFNNGYVSSDYFDDDFIVAPKLGDNAGIMGAYLLAKRAFDL